MRFTDKKPNKANNLTERIVPDKIHINNTNHISYPNLLEGQEFTC